MEADKKIAICLFKILFVGAAICLFKILAALSQYL